MVGIEKAVSPTARFHAAGNTAFFLLLYVHSFSSIFLNL